LLAGSGLNSQPEIREEHQDNEVIDVELEELETFHDIDRPWNPESIRVTTKSFSIRNMLDAIDEDSLDLAPDFQRLQVWKPVQKAQLIESILLQIPLPAFYFAEDTEGSLRVVDGLQRLSTIHAFVRGGSDGKGGFKLDGVEYIGDVAGSRFVDLPPVWQRRIYNTQITANVIDPSTPTPVMYDIFRRINTGGTPLNAQEIRHCMSKSRSREFLKRLTQLIEFERTTGGVMRNQRRMIDREVALRFCAFARLGPTGYVEPMDEFLWNVTEQLDDPETLSENDLELLAASFSRGLNNAYAIFGDHAFRKWPTDVNRLLPFNRALFESWTVVLSQHDEADVADAADEIRDSAREAMTNDVDYVSAITASTGDRRRVRLRFARAAELAGDALDAD
jgi:hypothetical protein